MSDVSHRQGEVNEKGVPGYGPSGCGECGWRGVPTFIDGVLQHECPHCTISNDEYLKMLTPPPPKQGRNEPCACGSGKKFKKCCGR